MSDEFAWYRDLLLERTAKSLEKNGFSVLRASNRNEAVAQILALIPEGSVVGIGGSLTLRQIGLPEVLEKRGFQVADHWKAVERKAPPEEISRIRKLHGNSDVFLTSTNALTEKGELVNTDGAGQRVAAMIFGPKRVIVVAGVNKIVKDLDAAFERIKSYAAPINAFRLDKKTPCAQSGVCTDCDSKARICNVTTIIHKKPQVADMCIVLIDEQLGY
jgi:L-lactate utilization protein LutB